LGLDGLLNIKYPSTKTFLGIFVHPEVCLGCHHHKNLAPTLFCMNQCITRITWFFSCSLQVFVLNNYQNYVELESIATRKQQKKLLEILTAFRSTISIDIQGGKNSKR